MKITPTKTSYTYHEWRTTVTGTKKNQRLELTEALRDRVRRGMDQRLQAELQLGGFNQDRAEDVLKKHAAYCSAWVPKRIIWCGSPTTAILGGLITSGIVHRSGNRRGFTRYNSRRSIERNKVNGHPWSNREEIQRFVSKEAGRLVPNSPSYLAEVERTMRNVFYDNKIETMLPTRKHYGEWFDRVSEKLGVELGRSVRNVVRSAFMDEDFVDPNAYTPAILRRLEAFDLHHLKIDERIPSTVASFKYNAAYEHMVYDSVHLNHLLQTVGLASLRSERDITRWWGVDREVRRYTWGFFPLQDRTFAIRKPKRLMVNDQNELHSTAGPALEWLDGTKFYYVNGTRVPGAWIETPEVLTPEVALRWGNIEQRRIACDLLGWNHILDKLRGQVIQEDPDPQIGTLVEVTVPGLERSRFLRVKCGTGRDFALPVPRTVHTAKAANAWTLRRTEREWIVPEVRT